MCNEQRTISYLGLVVHVYLPVMANRDNDQPNPGILRYIHHIFRPFCTVSWGLKHRISVGHGLVWMVPEVSSPRNYIVLAVLTS